MVRYWRTWYLLVPSPFMSSGPTGWLPLVLTGLVTGGLGSVVGSVITTYGSGMAARREARSKVIACLTSIENKRTAFSGERFLGAKELMRELETLCLIAGIRAYAWRTYEQAINTVVAVELMGREGTVHIFRASGTNASDADRYLGDALIKRAASCVSLTVWHPWLSASYTYLTCRMLRRALKRSFPIANQMRTGIGLRQLVGWRRYMNSARERISDSVAPMAPGDREIVYASDDTAINVPRSEAEVADDPTG